MNKSPQKSYRPFIIIVSVLLPLAVAMLYFAPKLVLAGVDLSFLPEMNAIINGLTFMMLTLGWMSVKSKIINMHKKFMTSAIVLSVVFLLSYILFHLTTEPTTYGGEGFLKYLYYFFLLSHILLSVAVVPLVLITYVRAWSRKFDKHKKIARITIPIWLYVCISGVIVYYMIEPYY